MRRRKTYRELSYSAGLVYYAVIYLPNGMDYYSGGFTNRSSARRYAIREQAKHNHADRNGMVYNVRI